ncbi:response regulator transcription factor [Anaerolineales bacterium]
MPLVMAIDDDPDVLGTLGRVLRREKLDVELVSSGVEALNRLKEISPDLIILDIIMPGMDGIEVCNQIRKDPRLSTTPILFLTAKGSTDDIVRGLDTGADDYLIKPFELMELQARVRALLRRGVREPQQDNAIIVLNQTIQLNSNTHQVTVDNETIQLTVTEHRLLRYLIENMNKAVSLSQLLEHVWDYPQGTGDPDLVRAHVRNLRVKVDRHAEDNYIRTIHGVGYMLVSKL